MENVVSVSASSGDVSALRPAGTDSQGAEKITVIPHPVYGKISPKKGLDFLVEAYQSRPPGFFPGLRIMGRAVPGNEAHYREIQGLVKSEYGESIRFPDYLSESQKDAVFRKISLMIFPCRWVSQSGALVESCRYRILPGLGY